MFSQVAQTDSAYGTFLPTDERSVLYEMRMNEFCRNYISQGTQPPPQPAPNDFLNLNVTTRPRCSISPINLDNTNADTSESISSATAVCNESSNYNYNQVGPTTYNQHLSYNSSALTVNSMVDSGYQSLHENSSTSFNLPNVNTIFASSSPYYSANLQTNKPTNKHLMIQHTDKPVRFQSTPAKPSSKKVNFHSILDLAVSSEPQPPPHSTQSDTPSFSYTSFDSSSSVPSSSSSLSSSGSDLLDFNEKLRLMSQSIASNKENHPCDISKTKRKPRTQITKQQKEILEYAYAMRVYPDSNEIEYLCNLLGFEENVIRIWFQNKRARHKQRPAAV